MIFLVLFSCRSEGKKSVDFLKKIDITEWNQLTINSLIDSFRIDTTSFNQLKHPPPSSRRLKYTYPRYAMVLNNDFATVWYFINRRYTVLNIIDSLSLENTDSFKIFEYYSLFESATYRVSDGISSFEIELRNDGSFNVDKINELGVVTTKALDYRGNPISPITGMTIKTIIDNHKNTFRIEELYIE